MIPPQSSWTLDLTALSLFLSLCNQGNCKHRGCMCHDWNIRCWSWRGTWYRKVPFHHTVDLCTSRNIYDISLMLLVLFPVQQDLCVALCIRLSSFKSHTGIQQTKGSSCFGVSMDTWEKGSWLLSVCWRWRIRGGRQHRTHTLQHTANTENATPWALREEPGPISFWVQITPTGRWTLASCSLKVGQIS